MSSKNLLAISLIACLASSCAQDGGGPLGLVMFDKNKHVASAEPLFEADEDRCFDSPAFLLTAFTKVSEQQLTGEREVCGRLRAWLRSVLPFETVFGTGDKAYTPGQRNEILDALIATSNRKCGRYIAFLQQHDANVNTTLGILSQATAILATVSSGGTAQGFAAASGISSGARGTLNEAHFANQTIGVLANAFDHARTVQRIEMTKWQQCPVASYTLMRGLEDAFRYHSSCSIVIGLKETQRAVEQARAPSLESFNGLLDQIEHARQRISHMAEAPQTIAGNTDAQDGEKVNSSNKDEVERKSANGSVGLRGAKQRDGPDAPSCPTELKSSS